MSLREQARKMSEETGLSVDACRSKLRRFSKKGVEAAKKSSDGTCAICFQGGIKLHIDHNHATGEVRGLLCPACNHGLGNFRDSPKLLLLAVEYLKNPPARTGPRPTP